LQARVTQQLCTLGNSSPAYLSDDVLE
jgi:hypothetical protein